MQIGKYTVRCALRFDNPAWPKYLIFHGEKLLGAQFSMPNISDCRWHEHRRGQFATAAETKADPTWQLNLPNKRPGQATAIRKGRAGLGRLFREYETSE